MNIAMHLQALAQISSGRILNCTIEGIGIALFAWILLRAFGRQNSGTQFAVWFSALLAIAMLPLLDNSALHGAKVTKHLEITMPGSWALYIFAVRGCNRSDQNCSRLLARTAIAKKLRANQCSGVRSLAAQDP